MISEFLSGRTRSARSRTRAVGKLIAPGRWPCRKASSGSVSTSRNSSPRSILAFNSSRLIVATIATSIWGRALSAGLGRLGDRLQGGADQLLVARVHRQVAERDNAHQPLVPVED